MNGESRSSRGIGSFFFAAIPAALGCAALTWLAFLTGIVEFKHSEVAYTKQQTYEGRREMRVGVNGEILKPVDLVFQNKGCLKIERAFLDTQTLTIYLHNECPTDREFVHMHVREFSPDGTIVQSQDNYLFHNGGNASIEQGAKAEDTIETSNDARVVKIVVSTDGGRAP